MSYASSTGSVRVNLLAGEADGDGGVGHDLLLNIESVLGSGGADELRGNAGNNRLDGGGGGRYPAWRGG